MFAHYATHRCHTSPAQPASSSHRPRRGAGVRRRARRAERRRQHRAGGRSRRQRRGRHGARAGQPRHPPHGRRRARAGAARQHLRDAAQVRRRAATSAPAWPRSTSPTTASPTRSPCRTASRSRRRAADVGRRQVVARPGALPRRPGERRQRAAASDATTPSAPGNAAGNLASIATVEAPDDSTVVLTLAQPDN